MIKQLTIKNFAIIDDLKVDFDDGMIALTGETGAGKSIIINALSLLLGERASADMIRHGANKAYIEGVFYVNNRILNEINELVGGVEETTLIVNREIDISGRSTIRLNSRITTINLLKSVMSKFIDIHSQHDNQYLLDKKNHLKLLDYYTSRNHSELYKDFEEAYKLYQKSLKAYKLAKEEELSSEQIEFFRFQLNEIDQVNLKENEIEELEAESKRMASFEKINEKLSATLAYLKNDDGVVDLLYNAQKNLEYIADDQLFNSYLNRVNDLYYQLVDLTSDLDRESHNLYFDENRYNEIQNRLFTIAKLKRKYGNSYKNIKAYRDEIANKIENFDNLAYYLEKKYQETVKTKEKAMLAAEKLSKARKAASLVLAKEVKKQLNDLSLTSTLFEIDFKQNEELSSSGYDDSEFLVSLNPGQPLKPLIKVASGGEISRLMLGLKVVFNQLFGILSIVFDEVDTGVSGAVASQVGRKMKELSSSMQVICITHLPQVAACANAHYHVSKMVSDGKTYTILRNLNEKERINEVAKMLSGENVTQASLLNAKELLEIK